MVLKKFSDGEIDHYYQSQTQKTDYKQEDFELNREELRYVNDNDQLISTEIIKNKKY